MASPTPAADSRRRPASLAHVRTLVIRFPTFTPRITFHANGTLTVEIVDGEDAGFRDTIPYQAVEPREGLVVLSWLERIGSTVVHVLDLDTGHAYTVVARAEGSLLRMEGRIELGWSRARHR